MSKQSQKPAVPPGAYPILVIALAALIVLGGGICLLGGHLTGFIK